MAEKSLETKVSQYLREPLEAAQARVAVLEREVQKRLKGLAKEWKLEARMDRLLQELAGLRVRVLALMGIASREQVEEMSKELARLTRRLGQVAKSEKAEKTMPTRNGAKRPALEA